MCVLGSHAVMGCGWRERAHIAVAVRREAARVDARARTGWAGSRRRRRRARVAAARQAATAVLAIGAWVAQGVLLPVAAVVAVAVRRVGARVEANARARRPRRRQGVTRAIVVRVRVIGRHWRRARAIDTIGTRPTVLAIRAWGAQGVLLPVAAVVAVAVRREAARVDARARTGWAGRRRRRRTRRGRARSAGRAVVRRGSKGAVGAGAAVAAVRARRAQGVFGALPPVIAIAIRRVPANAEACVWPRRCEGVWGCAGRWDTRLSDRGEHRGGAVRG